MVHESITGATADRSLQSAVDEERSPAAPSTGDSSAPTASSALGASIALGVALAIGALFLVAPLLWQIMPITPLPAPFPDTHQNAETLIYLVAFALLVPAGIFGADRLTNRIAAGSNASAFSGVVALLTNGVAAVLILTRISTDLPWGGGPGILAVLGLLWWIFAVLMLRVAATPRPSGALSFLREHSTALWWACGALLVGVVVSFADLSSVTFPALVAGLVLSAGVLAACGRERVPNLPRPLGIVIDIAWMIALSFAVPNLVVFVTGASGFLPNFQNKIIQYHQDFFLGPANQILAGDAMLVNVLSQYGVGSIYFLAGVFLVLPIGNGTLGLVEGVLSALMFIGTFSILRIAGVSRLLAGAVMSFAVVVLVYGLDYPLGGLLQHGAIRYGLPVGLIVGAVAESRWPKAKRGLRALQLVVVAIASIWALEAFGYTLVTMVAIVAFHVVTRPGGQRRREVLRWAMQVGAAVLTGHLVFAVTTLAASGSLPDWGWYLHTLREFLAGTIGDWTYDFSTFSWGLLIGGIYVVSAVGLTTIVIRRRDLLQRRRTLMLAITAMTAYGIALFSYLVNRSADHIIPYVSLPAVALGALWLALLGRPELGASPHAKRAALAGALVVASLWVAVAWSSVGTRYSQSALAYAIPGGPSLAEGVDRLVDRPVVQSGALEGEQLLRRFTPGERRSMVIVGPDLAIEILLRTGRASSIPFGDPIEDSFVPDGHFEALGKFVDHLSEGKRALLDPASRSAFERYRSQPKLEPLLDVGLGEANPGLALELAPLQKWVLRRIGQRFDLRTVTRTASGLEIVELVKRPGSP